MLLLKFIGVFTAYFLLDAAWAFYVRHIAERNVVPAAFWSAVTVALGALGLLAIVNEPVTLIAACAGAAAGTYVVVRLK